MFFKLVLKKYGKWFLKMCENPLYYVAMCFHLLLCTLVWCRYYFLKLL